MKPTFIGHQSPLLIAMITENSPEECVPTMRNAIYNGADAFALHLDVLPLRYHNIEDLRRIFVFAQDKPVLSINYRNPSRSDLTDDDLIEGHFTALKAGATMCDIMGDIYDPSFMELSKKKYIIDRQKSLVEKIHSMGGEVLMSSHTWCPMTAQEVIEHAKALESRGADMVKIAMIANNEDEMLEAVKGTALLKRELKVPYLHVCMGQYGKLHRVIAPMLGSAMVLCVPSYTILSHKEQPLLRATRAVLDNIDWKLARDTSIGTRKQ